MITSADEYLVIDTSGCESCITGEILPKRVKQRGGKGWIMRYEDLLFLTEGKMERVNWKTGVGEKAARPSRAMKYSTANYALYVMNRKWEDYLDDDDWCDAQQQIGEGEGWSNEGEVNLKETYNEGDRNEQAVANTGLKNVADVEIEDATLKSRVLSRANFLAAYRNLEKLTRTREYVNIGSWVKARERYARFDDDGETKESTTSEWYDGGKILWKESAGKWVADIEESQQSLPELPKRPYAERARLLTGMTAEYRDRRKDDESGEYKDTIIERGWDVAIELTVGAGGQLEWPNNITEKLIDIAFGKMGKSRSIALAPFGRESGETKSAQVNMVGLSLLVIDNEFPATPESEENGGGEG